MSEISTPVPSPREISALDQLEGSTKSSRFVFDFRSFDFWALCLLGDFALLFILLVGVSR